MPKLPPNIFRQQYRTRGNYLQTRYYVRFKDWKGRRRSFPAGPSLTLARQYRDKLLGENAQRIDFDRVEGKIPLFFAWADKFLKLKAGKKSIDKDILSVARLKGFFGDCRLEEFVPSWMEEYRNKRGLEEVRDSTINRELSCLKSILRLAYLDGQLIRLPRITIPEEHNERTRIASLEESQAILKRLKGQVKDVVELLWEMGFRLSEVLSIELRDLDTRSALIHLSRIRSKKGLRRDLPLSKKALDIFLARSQGKRAGGSRIFTVDRFRVAKAFRTACKELDIRGLWVHDLRGTFITRKLREGWDREFVKQYTGHRTDNAFKRYIRPTEDDLRRFINSGYEVAN